MKRVTEYQLAVISHKIHATNGVVIYLYTTYDEVCHTYDEKLLLRDSSGVARIFSVGGHWGALGSRRGALKC